MRAIVACAGAAILLVLSGWFAWSLLRPIIEIPASGDVAATICGTIVVFSIGGGVLGGLMFHLITRPHQLRLSYYFSVAVLVLSLGFDALMQQRVHFEHTVTLAALWTLPFLTGMLAEAGVSQLMPRNR